MRQVHTHARRTMLELRQRLSHGVGLIISPGVDGFNLVKMI